MQYCIVYKNLTRIKSIHSSLAIENNNLSLFRVEAVINGKNVISEQKDKQEFKKVYNEKRKNKQIKQKHTCKL